MLTCLLFVAAAGACVFVLFKIFGKDKVVNEAKELEKEVVNEAKKL